MTYYRFSNEKLHKVYVVLLLFLTQLLARSTTITSVFFGFVRGQLTLLGIVFVAGLIFVIANRHRLKQILTDQRMIAVLLATILVLGNMAIKQDWRLMYFSILICFYFAIFLTYLVPLQEAAYYYVLIMFGLSAYALLGQFVLKPMVNMGLLPAWEFKSSGGWYMYNFGLTFAANHNIFSLDTSRMFGIFREPGLYQIFLFSAIQLNNYTVEWDKSWKMWVVNLILFTTLLTTFATGGVVALGLYIVFIFFDKKMYKDKRMCILAVCLVLAGIGALAYILAQNGTWATELIWMFQKITEGTDSYTDRVGSVLMDAKIFLQHPLVGDDIEAVLYSVPNNTASSAILFAAFGIVMGAVHVLSWAALAWRKDRCIIMNLILMVILYMPCNTQNVIHDMYFWLFPIMALVEKGLPLLQKRK